jgi:L,D-peptidoglycan transpeptidase YkuD (ErfK/YbiS/YcfS/YnhG family)
MIIYLNTIYKCKLIFKKKVSFCQLGKNGKVPNYKKKEGDKCTPTGKFTIKSIFLRRDKKLNIPFRKSIKNKINYIRENYGWCDDVDSKKYNQLVDLIPNFNYSHEKLYRCDDVYDIILELNYNQNPTIRNKGSAIFLHCSFIDLRNTNGCIAIKKNSLKFIINNLQKINYIYIR